jgi:hypothetical protein
MSLRIGVWIDHEKAILTRLVNGSVETRKILSEVGPHVRLSGGARSKTTWGPQDVVSDGPRDRKYRNELTRYYDRVVRELGDAESILILGPGEAKGELRAAIEGSGKLASRIAAVEPADKMTDCQITARVRSFFKVAIPRGRRT